MEKIKINNEIILMRKNAVQARVQVIKKLTRSALKLRTMKGTDEQKAKNIRKADRIVAEILSVKKMKKDEITKYALSNTLNLKETLENRESEPLTKIMARIANHKKFSEKLSEFKSKYPNYMQFLGPGQKKKAKLERKEKRKLKAGKNGTDGCTNDSQKIDDDSNNKLEGINEDESIVDENEVSAGDNTLPSTIKTEIGSDEEDENDQKVEDKTRNKTFSSTIKTEDESDEEDEDDEDGNENDTASEGKIKSQIECEISDGLKKNRKDKGEKMGQSKKLKKVKLELENEEALKKSLDKKKIKEGKEQNKNKHSNIVKRKSDTSKIISKQAIVKKFTDILKEEDTLKERPDTEGSEEINTISNTNFKIEKEIDPFFVTGDGESNYLSVALPKHDPLVNDDYDYNEHQNKFNKRQSSRQQNDKFFSKVSKFNNDSKFQRDDSRFERNNSKFQRNKTDQGWSDRKSNEKPYRSNKEWNKADPKKFNGQQRNDRSKVFEKQSKANSNGKSDPILHPSWEAKKKQQEILKQGFQGKKIVFGDDI